MSKSPWKPGHPPGHSKPSTVSGALDGDFLVWGLLATVVLNLGNMTKDGRLPFTSDVQYHRLDRVDHSLSSLPQREDAHTEGTEKQP